MSISTISQISGLLPTQATGASSVSAATDAASSGMDFSSLTSAVDSVEKVQDNADALAIQAVTGELDDVHDYTIAASQASVALELTAAVRNKAVEAFNEIMRMQA